MPIQENLSGDKTIDLKYQLADRYKAGVERLFLTGTQALVRVVLDQAQRDRKAGLNTAGFISGYRGSPLGGVDMELWKAKKMLSENKIEFLPAINEDLAATAVLGTQQVETSPDREVEGVYAMWYGKGPGVDRSGDALKHGNAYGSSPTGGVLVVVGDDHGCVSSSTPHQSDVALMSWLMPVLHPANINEFQAFGEYGYALSRYSGMWVGFKAVSETVESAASVQAHEDRVFLEPDYQIPADGLHYRWPDLPGPQIEERLVYKKEAVFAFAEANPIDRHIYTVEDADFGIVTTGKAHLDLMEALRLLGVDEASCRQLGIDIYKVGMVWPLARRDALDFVRGKREILVIEEKRGIIESQFKEYFYDFPGDKPKRMVGKRDENGNRLVPWTGELSPLKLVPIVASRLERIFPGTDFVERAKNITGLPTVSLSVEGTNRTPYFCSGCPHNTSTRVPEGSKALAGIGCHFMASWMNRDTTSLIQMGGEGVNWVGSSRFTGNKHIFQNLGDGTYYHSGSMAIRQAIAANTNITYKILFNDAVAMTGGQPTDGPVSVEAIAHEVRAEGVRHIDVVSDTPEKFRKNDFPPDIRFYHRDELDSVQRAIREISGVTVLIYEQTCATEKRRRRKRGLLTDPPTFAFINDAVCEGCGDCSVESNCLSIEPLETLNGRKRKINLSTCNKDFSCLNGFCPSFVRIEGAKRRTKTGVKHDPQEWAADFPLPKYPSLSAPYDLIITGVGGTGVVTVGALVTMAAHLEGNGATVLDFTGFAQKFGPVISYVRLAENPDSIHQVRIGHNAADALIGCDIVTSSSPKASASYRAGMRGVLNLAEMPTGDIVQFRDANLAVDQRVAAIETVTGTGNLSVLDANAMAERLLGNSVFANIIMLGFAWQSGLVPVSLDAILRAIELNGVAIDENRKAFAWGRIASAAPEKVAALEIRKPPEAESLEQLIVRHAAFLTAYQNAAYANQYAQRVRDIQTAELPFESDSLSRTVATSLFRLMAYKDEYEVARLHSSPEFAARINEQFEGDFSVKYYLAIPFLPARKDARGRPRKRSYGPWMQHGFKLLAKMKIFRGSIFDPFGYTEERKTERELIRWYNDLVDQAVKQLTPENFEEVRHILALPQQIRGYGPVKKEAEKKVRDNIAGLDWLQLS